MVRSGKTESFEPRDRQQNLIEGIFSDPTLVQGVQKLLQIFRTDTPGGGAPRPMQVGHFLKFRFI